MDFNDLNDLVEKFNNGDLDVKMYFNDYNTFFNLLKKRDLMQEIDPHNATDGVEWQNEYFIWLYHNNKEAFYKWIPTVLDDVIFKDGIFYLEINNRSDLSKVFCKNDRNGLSRDTIESILDGENDWEPMWDTTENVYRDVIEELDESNLIRLKEYIVLNLEGEQIEPETELLEEIAEEQGHSGYVIVTADNVNKVLNSEETMSFLLKNNLSDLKSELYSIHSGAYNSAYEDEIYKSIFNELGTYFIGDGEFITRPHTYKKNTEVQNFIIPIANFESNILDYLINNKGYNNGTLEYWGSYLNLLEDDFDCLSVHSPDYPDFRQVDKNINLYFKDYI
jgi:hypothetical protein